MAIRENAKQWVILTEGEKKALCGCINGFPTIGLGGSNNFLLEGGLLPELDQWTWSGRFVYIAYDSDSVDNKRVMDAEESLATELALRGAIVCRVRIPRGPVSREHPLGAKMAMDDYIVEHGPDSFQGLLEQTPEEDNDDLMHAPTNILDIAVAKLPPINWIIPNFLLGGHVNTFYGEPGLGKSFLVLKAAIHIALGKDLFGMSVTPTPVLCVFSEDAKELIQPRVHQILANLGYGNIDSAGRNPRCRHLQGNFYGDI